MTATTLDYIELPAPDLTATKAFYERVFGWTFIDYGPTYAAATVSGVEVGCNAEATVAPAPAAGSENSIGPLVLLRTSDLEAVRSMLADQGDVIVAGPFGYPGGNRLHFRDPSGNILGVYQPS